MGHYIPIAAGQVFKDTDLMTKEEKHLKGLTNNFFPEFEKLTVCYSIDRTIIPNIRLALSNSSLLSDNEGLPEAISPISPG